jgi:uncharacterized protein YgiM (DUF1202 family)
MKNVILLLFLLVLSYSTFSQNNKFLNHSTTPSATTTAAFAKFEETVFTQSDTRGIITSYISLGKQHQHLGHSADAFAFYERAYILAKSYYHSLSEDKNLLNQLENSYQSLLALGLQNHSFKNDREGVHALRYLQQSGQPWIVGNNTPRHQQQSSSEEKIVAGFFFAVTEEAPNRIVVESFTMQKATSLRKKATHRSSSLKRLRAGRNVNVIEKTSQFWWKVEVDGMVGYAKALLME